MIWLVGCFGLNGPLRQYSNLYRAVSQREGERREMIDKRKKYPNNPHPHLLQVQLALALLLSILVSRPGTGSLPSTTALPDHPRISNGFLRSNRLGNRHQSVCSVLKKGISVWWLVLTVSLNIGGSVRLNLYMCHVYIQHTTR